MSNEAIKQTFLDAADAWICDGYSLDIRYIGDVQEESIWIWDASISLNPLPAKQDLSFHIESSNFVVGQIQSFPEKKKTLLSILSKATNGLLSLSGKELTLSGHQPYNFYSEMSHRERWFCELHIRVNGDQREIPSSTLLATIDNNLRASQPPFDGLTDAASWLGLVAPGISACPSIAIRVGPPIDLIFDKCRLANDRLHLTLHAHPKFDVERVGLALRSVPGNGLEARKQVSSDITWGRVRDGRREGTVQLDLEHAESVLAILMIGTSTVRRQWFIDPTKARNNRLLAIQHFDKDLRMIKNAVFDSTDSSKFEQGVAALLFLLGFSPSVQLETDSPDLIVTTPSGRLAIIECTTRIADFASKIGKLVDRRGALSKSLVASRHPAQVSAVLVCRLPRDQIAAYADEARAQKTILVAGEDLEAGFDSVRFPNDPDQILQEALARINGNTPSEELV